MFKKNAIFILIIGAVLAFLMILIFVMSPEEQNCTKIVKSWEATVAQFQENSIPAIEIPKTVQDCTDRINDLNQ